jgi:hypothetical protein
MPVTPECLVEQIPQGNGRGARLESANLFARAGALVEANSRLALSESIAEVAGPPLTGVLLQTLTAPEARTHALSGTAAHPQWQPTG